MILTSRKTNVEFGTNFKGSVLWLVNKTGVNKKVEINVSKSTLLKDFNVNIENDFSFQAVNPVFSYSNRKIIGPAAATCSYDDIDRTFNRTVTQFGKEVIAYDLEGNNISIGDRCEN